MSEKTHNQKPSYRPSPPDLGSAQGFFLLHRCLTSFCKAKRLFFKAARWQTTTTALTTMLISVPVFLTVLFVQTHDGDGAEGVFYLSAVAHGKVCLGARTLSV